MIRKQVKFAPAGKPFIGTSGKKLDYYVDFRPLLIDHHFLVTIAGTIWSVCSRINCKSVAGPELGGAQLVTNVVSSFGMQGAVVRKTEDLRHKDGIIFSPSFNFMENTLILDDVATSGGSLMKAINRMRSLNVPIENALVIFDRCEGAEELLAAENVTLYSIFTSEDL
jgi:orotate phosphoribosyltransferase